jgi:hypothetical protein
LQRAGLLVLSWWTATIVLREHGTTADKIFRVTALGAGADGKT